MPNMTLSDSVFERAAEKFATPFHLYDEKGIRENARKLNEAFGWCGDFREYFAVKALPNPAILRILKEEGCGADCSSATELTLAEACGAYACSTPRIDSLCDLMNATEGVLGSELSGAGLGGCVLILVEKEKTDAVMDRLNREFYDCLGLPHAAFVCRPSNGSCVFY